MRKYILSNPSIIHYLIFGSLFLGMLRVALSVYDVVETGDVLSSALKYIAGAMFLTGIVLRLYEAKLLGSWKSLMIRIAIGVAIVIVMLLAGLIHTPSAFSDLF